MVTRRRFLGVMAYPAAFAGLAAAAPSLAFGRARGIVEELRATPGGAEELAGDEDFWWQAGQAFTVDRSVINLNNGGVSPSPAIVQEAMKRHLDFSNTMPPPVALWRILEPQKEGVRQRLARRWGVDPEEIAITRNSSEALQICQFGIDLKAGDEILCCTHDYPRMLTTFRQRCRREGLAMREVRLPIPAEDDGEVLRLYEGAISPRTRLILLSHIVNITGQILPVRRLVDHARGRNGGIPVVVDGAHALAHFEFRIPDLGCDYYGVSLHKWLFAPHGTGLLYVRREKIGGLWPLMAAEEKQAEDIRKFEEIGTHPAANFLAIGEALTFHEGLGGDRKEARLRHLRDAWAKRLLSHPSGRVRLHTSLKRAHSCGIATVQVEGLDGDRLVDWLWEKRRVLTVSIKHPEFEGVRVTPSVYTTMEEIDRFCGAVEEAIARGV